MHPYVQNSSRTILPRRADSVSGAVTFSQSTAPTSSGARIGTLSASSVVIDGSFSGLSVIRGACSPGAPWDLGRSCNSFDMNRGVVLTRGAGSTLASRLDGTDDGGLLVTVRQQIVDTCLNSVRGNTGQEPTRGLRIV